MQLSRCLTRCIQLYFIILCCCIGCIPVDKKSSEFISAACSGKIDVVKRLVGDGVSVDAIANDGWTALTIAAREGHLDIVEYLLDKKAKINKPEGGGNTALFWAAYNGHTGVVKLLIARGADPMAKCNDCSTPLDIAVHRGHRDVVDYLSSVQLTGKMNKEVLSRKKRSP